MASIFDHLPKPELAPAGPAPARAPRVLVVDDQPINVKLLERKLEREGMLPLVAENGLQCLEIARAERPDIILLDVMMPEMDGIEACRLLQAKPETREIPIIFITARSGKDGKLEGLGAGAVDYIVKPIDLDETMARVRTQLRVRDYHRENLALQQRLAEARRQAMLGQITLGLSHNLNNLLGIVVGYLDLMRTAPGNAALVTRSIGGMDKGLRRIGQLISQVLILGEHTRPIRHEASLADIVRDACATFASEQEYEGELTTALGELATLRFVTNAATLKAALVRVLHNAADATGRVRHPARIVLSAEFNGSGAARRLILNVKDNGAGLDRALADTLFEPFISVKAEVGAGLGLPLARHAVELLGGTLALADSPDGGAIATLSLPVPDTQEKTAEKSPPGEADENA